MWNTEDDDRWLAEASSQHQLALVLLDSVSEINLRDDGSAELTWSRTEADPVRTVLDAKLMSVVGQLMRACQARKPVRADGDGA